jgi:transglutaminase/protease-like cytokinesis protein 3
MIRQVNEHRMTQAEQNRVNRFTASFGKRYADLSDKQKLVKAVKVISQLTQYEAGKHNPSDALQGKANCQGYSIMLYLMLERLNMPCKVIYNETHMWNEVLVNGKWEVFDVTGYDSIMKGR